MEESDVQVAKRTKSPKIAFVGVGEAGSNVLDLIAKSEIGDKVKLVAVDEALGGAESRNADVKIELHKDEPVPGSLRPFVQLSYSREGALEVYDEIKDALMQ